MHQVNFRALHEKSTKRADGDVGGRRRFMVPYSTSTSTGTVRYPFDTVRYLVFYSLSILYCSHAARTVVVSVQYCIHVPVSYRYRYIAVSLCTVLVGYRTCQRGVASCIIIFYLVSLRYLILDITSLLYTANASELSTSFP